MMATKEQELKALAQIRKIVEGLGEDSYVATAFEGCFEIAEDNIGNDFACSMKQRAEKAQEEADYFKHIAENATDDNDKYQKEIEELSTRVLSKDDLNTIDAIITGRQNENNEKLLRSEETIIEYCEDASSEEFLEAVERHKEYKKTSEKLEGLKARIRKASKAY